MDAPQGLATTQGSGEPLLAVAHLTKSYGAVHAVDDVSFSLFPGELVALMGGNGAGKSTLLKTIAGAIDPDGGSVTVEGRALRPGSPESARAWGVECVYQDVALVPYLDIGSNMFLGRELGHGNPILRRLGFVDQGRMRHEAATFLRNLGVSVPSAATWAESLSGGQRQALAVSRGVFWDPKLMLLDEPTAALGVHESAQVLKLIANHHGADNVILMVTNSLDQAFILADRLLVMYLGRLVGDLRTADSSPSDVAQLMAGLARPSDASSGGLTPTSGPVTVASNL